MQILQLPVYPAKVLIQNDRFPHFSPIHLEEVLQYLLQHLQAVDVAAVVVDHADPVIINIK
jgi:hypothetical protein